MLTNTKPELRIFLAQSFAFSSSLLKLGPHNVVTVHIITPVRKEYVSRSLQRKRVRPILRCYLGCSNGSSSDHTSIN